MFSLCYLPTAGRLTLTVIKCRNLKAMDITGYSGRCLITEKGPIASTLPPPPLRQRQWIVGICLWVLNVSSLKYLAKFCACFKYAQNFKSRIIYSTHSQGHKSREDDSISECAVQGDCQWTGVLHEKQFLFQRSMSQYLNFINNLCKIQKQYSKRSLQKTFLLSWSLMPFEKSED